MPISATVDWYPHFSTFSEFNAEMKTWDDGTKTVYMALGPGNSIRYVGLTTNPRGRFNNHNLRTHAKHSPLKFMAGEITTAGLSGRRGTKQPPDLSLIEHLLIAYFEPELNERLKDSHPPDCVSLYSRFFSNDETEWHLPQDYLPKFPTLLAFN